MIGITITHKCACGVIQEYSTTLWRPFLFGIGLGFLICGGIISILA